MPGLVLSLLGVGRAVMSWLSKRSLAELACIALVLFAGVQTLRLGAEQRQNGKLKAQVVKCAQARQADQNAYRKAQDDAAANNKAHVQQIEQQQQRITDATEERYQADLARLRAELAKRLQQGGIAAPQGPANGTGSPQVPNATPVADDASRVSIPSSLYVRGAELELQLERLQDWVRQQSAVDPNAK